jgi:hypothetical protein
MNIEIQNNVLNSNVIKLWGAPPLPEGHHWSSGVGAQVDCMKDTFILNGIWMQDKIYIIWYAFCRDEMFYLSLSTGTGSEL